MPAVPERFTVHVPDELLADLSARLDRVRWPDTDVGAPWDGGTDLQFLQQLVFYWRDGFDWRAREIELNRWSHFRVPVGGLQTHFVHEPGRGPAPVPLLVLHGWPSTFTQMARVLPLLSDPAAHGGAAADAFSVVVPSLPGFGFSDAPTTPGMNPAAMGEVFHTLMTEVLGYDRYAVRGTDYGLAVALQMGLAHPEHVIGVHIGGTFLAVNEVPDDLSAAERRFVAESQRWYAEEAAYNTIQATKPQTIGYALNDSPAGLAAWIVEKYRTWCACPGDLVSVFGMDDLLTTITLYWATGTITSSMRLYRQDRLFPPAAGRLGVPLAVNQPELEAFYPPREWWERLHPVHRWTLLPGAGHFPEWEAPRALADDVRDFLRPLRRA
ncbi:epoxide hydrolase family protein [Actinomadura napierensis]|uniref:Epoxide hydrolase n=1 Tax=Actinomadura napierensis TaxID=267854 RepID=A0ABP5JZN1_9ACTN